MTIQDLQKLDLYKCSLQDINKADRILNNHLQSLIKKGHAIANNYKGSNQYVEAKKLHVLVSRAKSNMNPDGYMIGRNLSLDRLPNNQSVL